MIGLYGSLFLLGLAAIDPVGIAIMPLLLVQKNPYTRAWSFLGGSFLALMVMGLVCAKGFGQIVLRFEHTHSWFVPSVEIAAGIILIIIALVTFWHASQGVNNQPSERLANWLKLSTLKLFLIGGALVAVQSILDVVFVIALVRVGQIKLSNLALIGSVATYAVAALILQISVIVIYYITPDAGRYSVLNKVKQLLAAYANQAIYIISFGLGVVLLVFGLS